MAQATVLETPDLTLDGLLATPAGRAMLSCIQCGTCAGTCPYGEVLRYTPRRLHRHAAGRASSRRSWPATTSSVASPATTARPSAPAV